MMSSHLNHRRFPIWSAAVFGLTLLACTESTQPRSTIVPRVATLAKDVAAGGDPNSAAGDVKAFIPGWLDGKTVELRYTRSFYCEEPPTSVAPSQCEIGALPEDFPRAGPIPVIYAIAPIGFTPSDPSTLHCPGTPLCRITRR